MSKLIKNLVLSASARAANLNRHFKTCYTTAKFGETHSEFYASLARLRVELPLVALGKEIPSGNGIINSARQASCSDIPCKVPSPS